MKKGYIKYILFLAIFYTVLFTWKNNFLGRYFSSVVSGRVVDISQNSPIELVPVGSGQTSTFTNYNGEFVMSINNRASLKLKILTPRNYEPGSDDLRCKNVRDTFLDRTFFCETFLYPQSFEIAARVLNDEKAGEFQNSNERADRKKKLWDRSSKLSKDAFGTEGDFIFLLSRKEEIEIRKKIQLVNFDVRENNKIIDKYIDPITGENIPEVSEVQVVRYFADGSKSEVLEHFVREGGVWRYMIPFTHKSVYDFVVSNEWILKVKK